MRYEVYIISHGMFNWE